MPFIQLKGETELSSTIDSSGHFNISATLETAGIYKLISGGETLFAYVVPGKHIQLETAFPNPNKSIIFTRDFANENNYLNDYMNHKNSAPWMNKDSILIMNEITYTSVVEEYLAELLAKQQDWQKEKGAFDSDFAIIMSEELSYNAAWMKMQYPLIRFQNNRDSLNQISDTYDSFLQNIEIDNEDNLMVPAYQEFVKAYISYKVQSDTTNSNESILKKKFEHVDLLFENTKVREFAYYTLMLEAIQTSINDASSLISEFRRKVFNPELRSSIQEMFDQRRHLLPGSDAPDLSLITQSGSMTNLKKWKGKVLYISIWGSDCTQCLEDLAMIPSLQEKWKRNKDVIFIGISVDSEVKTWKASLASRKMKGIQLLADKDWGAQNKKDFMVTSLPRYILIGKDGKILNGNAPNPKDEKLQKLISDAADTEI